MQHTFTSYRRGCRCDKCKLENARRTNWYRMYGKRTTDPARARQHVAALVESGMSQPQIAALSGMSVSSINRLMYPHLGLTTIRKSNEAKILAVKPKPSPTLTVSAIPAQRRVRALMAMGWNQKQQAAKSGVSHNMLNAIAAGRRKTIRRWSDEKITALFDEISMIQGPDQRVRRYALSMKWFPPLAWDDIDDLSERPRWHGTVHWEHTRGAKKRRERK